MFPHISGGRVYLPFGGELADDTMVDGMYELPPEHPDYAATKEWLIQVERGEWALFQPSDHPSVDGFSAEAIAQAWGGGS